MVLWYLSRYFKLPLVEIQGKNMTAWWNFDEVLGIQVLDNHPLQDQPAMFTHDGAMHAAHCE